MGFFKNAKNFLFGKPEKFKQKSLLEPIQESLKHQLIKSAQKPGAAGAFGQSSDFYRSLIPQENTTGEYFSSLLGDEPQEYYRNLLSNENPDVQDFQAPELRRFYEDIIPDIAEQFAGMGSGALSSSGFRNAAISAGTDLSERLAQMRANLRQSGAQNLAQLGQYGAQGLNQQGQFGAQGLQNIGQIGLNPYKENILRPATSGFIGGLTEAAAKGITSGLVG